MKLSSSRIMHNYRNLVIFIQLLSWLGWVQASPSVRYLHGRLQLKGDDLLLLEVHQSTTIAKAWKHCQRSDKCVSFGFQASARYPGANVTVAYYSVADWHIASHLVETEPFFVPDNTWHLYVNTTREKAMVATEVQQVLAKMNALDLHMDPEDTSPEKRPSSGRLRSRSIDTDASEQSKKVRLLRAQEKLGWLLGLFNIARYKDLRMTLIPFLARPMIKIASDDDEIDDIRLIALEIILSLTDSYETPGILQGEYNLLGYMQAIIVHPKNWGENKGISWKAVNSMALDLISNMALHRTQNDPYAIPAGLWDMLQHIAKGESGSAVGLQASLALIHFWGAGRTKDSKIDAIPESTLMSLLELLEATIDGDAVYGYDWDIFPGPLSAIQYLVTGAVMSSEEETIEESASAKIVDVLLNAGLVEQLVRILDQSETLPSASTTLATLETLQLLRTLSPKAETIVAMVAATSIDETKNRLEEYESAKKVAQSLTRKVATHSLHQDGGWMDDNHEL